jgi:hypothetical protein
MALSDLIGKNEICNEDLVVILAGNFSGPAGFSFMEVGSAGYLKNRVEDAG